MRTRMIWPLGLLLFAIPTIAQTKVLTSQYDNMRTGANPEETILTPSNVNFIKFGKLFSQSVDGAIVGQALYLPAVSIPKKGTHNVVYVATMNDTVYAFDADTNSGTNAQPLWQTNLLSVLPSGTTPVPISVQRAGGTTGWTEVGVVSTPVIDSNTNILYVIAKDYLPGVANPVSNRLHGLDVATGKEMFTPVLMKASFTSGGKTYTFNNTSQVNRAALLLANGVLYIAFGSDGINNGAGPEQGWVLAYSAATSSSPTPKPLGAFADEPGKGTAAIWQTGGGLSADPADLANPAGSVYAATGDGFASPGTNFGESVLRLTLTSTGLKLADWFTPYNWEYLWKRDQDLTTSTLILPKQTGAHPYLAIAAGKEGTIYVLDRTSMGHLCTTCTHGDTQIVQELPLAAGPSLSFAYWNETVYTFGRTSLPIKAWALNRGLLSSTPTAESKVTGEWHSGIISANGTSNAILWQLNGPISTAGLEAFDAITLQQIYDARQAGTRDRLPAVAHFAKLMEVQGKVYVGTNSSLVVFGLLPKLGLSPAARSTEAFSLGGLRALLPAF